MANNSGWLIERHINGRLYYWSAGAPSLDRRADHYFDERPSYVRPSMSLFTGYCTDVDAAVRFARQEDASLVLNRLGGEGRVAEHQWMEKANG